MREIKFRAWDKEFKRMKVTGMGINNGILAGEEVEIMQYTGLKDKNGKEIYEGDIIQLFRPSGSKHCKPYLIKWDAQRCMFTDCHSGNRVEVIGNIYENPELLEAQKEGM